MFGVHVRWRKKNPFSSQVWLYFQWRQIAYVCVYMPTVTHMFRFSQMQKFSKRNTEANRKFWTKWKKETNFTIFFVLLFPFFPPKPAVTFIHGKTLAQNLFVSLFIFFCFVSHFGYWNTYLQCVSGFHLLIRELC